MNENKTRPYRVTFSNQVAGASESFEVDVLAYSAADAVTQVEIGQKGRSFRCNSEGKFADTFGKIEKVEPSPHGQYDVGARPRRMEAS
jgi:hypothetical protein